LAGSKDPSKVMRSPNALPRFARSLSPSDSIFSCRYEEIRHRWISRRATDCKFRRFASRQPFYRYWPSCQFQRVLNDSGGTELCNLGHCLPCVP
jgi:hypothetical protein